MERNVTHVFNPRILTQFGAVFIMKSNKIMIFQCEHHGRALSGTVVICVFGKLLTHIQKWTETLDLGS